ncbi:MAG TPA: CCC motif membrane protein [Bacteroidales bacterium]|nr:CCC motif membrane protein [Bacteroidales bacterium]
METINQTQQQPLTNRQLPNSTAVLVLGILSIVLCFCWGIFGVTLGIIALVLANKANALYTENPGVYSEGSYKNMKAGKICAIVGTSLSGLYMLFMIIYLSIVGAALGTIFSTMPWETFK